MELNSLPEHVIERKMLKVKICGITNLEDASLAVRLGADMLGFIFASSPRRTSPEVAKDILRQVPPFIKSVGVFVNEDPEVIRETINFCGIDMAQLHGDESPEFCNQFMPAAIKALKIKDESILQSVAPYKGKVKALLLDTYSEKMPGGTGKSFDWELAVKIREMGIPIILAGGLGPSNIEDAISTVQPYAVDVNSGVEESPGKKSPILMKELFEKITRIRIEERENRK